MRLLKDGTIRISWQRTTGGKQLQDTLTMPVSKALLSYRAACYGPELGTLGLDAPRVGAVRSQPAGRAMTTDAIADVCEKRLGISKVHALRHTFAKAMEDSGANVSEIQTQLGHAKLATTERYLAALSQADQAHAGAIVGVFGIEGEGGEVEQLRPEAAYYQGSLCSCPMSACSRFTAYTRGATPCPCP